MTPILPRFTSLGLLLFLIFFFVISPFLSHGESARFLLDLSVIILLSLSVYICSFKKNYFIFSLFLASPTVLRLFNISSEVNEITLLGNAAFFAFVIYILLSKLFSTKHITMDVIYSALSIYILIGVFWGIIYMVLEFFSPGSFLLPQESKGFSLYPGFGQDMIYYSFITLSTVGFGDILPLTQPAKSFTTLEALMGPLYIAVFVARLVGMHISQEQP